jgi:hypothetical protein
MFALPFHRFPFAVFRVLFVVVISFWLADFAQSESLKITSILPEPRWNSMAFRVAPRRLKAVSRRLFSSHAYGVRAAPRASNGGADFAGGLRDARNCAHGRTDGLDRPPWAPSWTVLAVQVRSFPRRPGNCRQHVYRRRFRRAAGSTGVVAAGAFLGGVGSTYETCGGLPEGV